MPPKIGNWYYGWTVVAVCMLFQGMLFGVTFYSFTLYASEWLADPSMQVSTARVMLGNTLLTLVAGIVSPAIGRALDRLSIRWLVCTGAAITSIGFVLVSLATNFWQIIAIYGCLLSFGIVLSGPLSAQTLVAKWFDGRRGTAMGIATTGTSIGGFVIPVIIGILFSEIGWRTAHLYIAATVFVLVVPAALLFIRNTPTEVGVRPDPPGATGRIPAPRGMSGNPHSWSTRQILTEPNFWVICGVLFLITCGFSAASLHLGPLASDLGIPKAQHGVLVSLYAAAMIPAKILFGLLSDRLDGRLLLWGALTCLGISVSLLLVADSFALLALACLFLGMAGGSMLPLMGNLVSPRFGTHAFGRVVGMLGPFNATAGFAPVVVGAMRDASGSYTSGWLLMLCLILPAALLTGFLDRIGRSRRSTPPN